MDEKNDRHGAFDLGQVTLSIVVPLFNEEAVLPEFHERTSGVLSKLDLKDYEILYVNDGSNDSSVSIVEQIIEADPHASLLELSRNFGKEIAMTAGLDYAKGDAVVLIDADLQDPPELIPEFLTEWRNGFDVVFATRARREGESALKTITARMFYRVIKRMSRVHIPEDTGDCRLLSRRAVDALAQLREQHRFMKGLFAWIGFPQKAILYERDPRFAGTTKFNYWKLWNFALEGITSFSTAPLRIATYFGGMVAFGAFVYALIIVFKTLAYGDPVAGYPSLMTVLLLFGGLQLMFIGIVGEYLGRMFDETKRRPLYVVDQYKTGKLTGGEERRTPVVDETG